MSKMDKQLAIGEKWDFSFAACSRHETLNEHFAGHGSRRVKMVLNEVTPSCCREIAIASRFPQEDEVMLLEGVWCEVLSIEKLSQPAGKEIYVINFSLTEDRT